MMMSAMLKPSMVSDNDCVSDDPTILAEIYQDDINLAIWQRPLPDPITRYVAWLLKQENQREIRTVIESGDVIDLIASTLPGHEDQLAFAKDVHDVVVMFSDLFDLKRVGMRLSILDKTMCPRFHTDNLPCRLVTTYQGVGTQWLPEHAVDRSKLAAGANGLPDATSGIYLDQSLIRQCVTGDVCLLKGRGWLGNEERAIVHRSPALDLNEKRLLLTLDFGA